MRDEVIPVRIRPSRISGAIHISRTGLISLVITALDTERFHPINEQARKSLAVTEGQASGVYASGEEWY